MVQKMKKDSIEIWTTVSGLTGVQDVLPVKSTKFIPSWWKNFPKEYTEGSVKSCPSFADLFSSGIIFPAWSDFKIYKDGEDWFWQTPNILFSADFQPEWQFSKYANSGKKIKASIKLNSPWEMKTPKGISTLFLPLFYNFNESFEVMPGIRDTDIFYNTSAHLAIFSEKDIFIERGQPLFMAIPFERKKYDFFVREATEKDLMNTKESNLKVNTKFFGGYLFSRKYENG